MKGGRATMPRDATARSPELRLLDSRSRPLDDMAESSRPQIAFSEILGQVIRRHRRDARLAQGTVAAMVVLSPSALCRIESGRRTATVVDLGRIAESLGTSASQILREAEALAAEIAKTSPGIRLTVSRPRADDAETEGWFLGGAAVGALLASMPVLAPEAPVAPKSEPARSKGPRSR
jgi:transcriptional regulator with XRE-family HTH domain